MRKPARVISRNGEKIPFYEIAQADELLHSRYMAAEVQTMFLRNGFSLGYITEMAQLLIDTAMNTKDPAQLRENVTAIGMNIKGRAGQLAEMTMYEEIACVFFMMDGEPAELLPEWQEKKKALWRANKEDRDFFIYRAFVRTNELKNISMTDILAALRSVDERVSQLPT